MKVNSVSSYNNVQFGTKKQTTNQSNPIKDGQDKYVSHKKNGKLRKLTAGLVTAINVLTAPFSTKALEKPIVNYESLSAADMLAIKHDNEFQLAQTLDAPSLTYDLTGNWGPEIYRPSDYMVYISDGSDEPGTYRNQADIIEDQYAFEPQEKEETYLAADSITKANPAIPARISTESIDFTQGDVTNIDPELMLASDLVVDGSKLAVYLPDIAVMQETNANNQSNFVAATALYPKNADQKNRTKFTLTTADFNNDLSENNIMNVVNSRLEDIYGIPSIYTNAGDSIWHSVQLYTDNDEVFRYSDEGDVAHILYKQLDRDGQITIVCPKVPISVIVGSDMKDNFDMTRFLLSENRLNGTIDYVTPDRTVVSTSELFGKDTTPLDVLELFSFPGGSNLKELYKENNEKYEGLLLSAYRQVIDNNNGLIDAFGDTAFDASVLTSPISENDNIKINLQPIAYEHVNYSNPVKAETNVIQAGPVCIDPCSQEPSITPFITPMPPNTITPMPPNTITPMPPNTVTPKPTNTVTPKPTNTITPTPTNTVTPTPPPETITPTPPETITPTPTNTVTPTPPPETITPTPPETITPTPTNTVTPTPPPETITPTPPETVTPTPTNTVTPTPPPETVTPTPPETVTPTPTNTVTPTPPPETITPTPPETVTPTPPETVTPIPPIPTDCPPEPPITQTPGGSETNFPDHEFEDEDPELTPTTTPAAIPTDCPPGPPITQAPGGSETNFPDHEFEDEDPELTPTTTPAATKEATPTPEANCPDNPSISQAPGGSNTGFSDHDFEDEEENPELTPTTTPAATEEATLTPEANCPDNPSISQAPGGSNTEFSDHDFEDEEEDSKGTPAAEPTKAPDQAQGPEPTQGPKTVQGNEPVPGGSDPEPNPGSNPTQGPDSIAEPAKQGGQPEETEEGDDDYMPGNDPDPQAQSAQDTTTEEYAQPQESQAYESDESQQYASYGDDSNNDYSYNDETSTDDDVNPFAYNTEDSSYGTVDEQNDNNDYYYDDSANNQAAEEETYYEEPVDNDSYGTVDEQNDNNDYYYDNSYDDSANNQAAEEETYYEEPSGQSYDDSSFVASEDNSDDNNISDEEFYGDDENYSSDDFDDEFDF